MHTVKASIFFQSRSDLITLQNPRASTSLVKIRLDVWQMELVPLGAALTTHYRREAGRSSAV